MSLELSLRYDVYNRFEDDFEELEDKVYTIISDEYLTVQDFSKSKLFDYEKLAQISISKLKDLMNEVLYCDDYNSEYTFSENIDTLVNNFTVDASSLEKLQTYEVLNKSINWYLLESDFDYRDKILVLTDKPLTKEEERYYEKLAFYFPIELIVNNQDYYYLGYDKDDIDLDDVVSQVASDYQDMNIDKEKLKKEIEELLDKGVY